MKILFFTNTPYHIFLSFLLIQQKGYNIEDCEIVVQHDFEFSSEVLPKIKELTLIKGNLEVNQENRIKRSIEKIKLFKQIKLLIKTKYNIFFIFNDKKEFTQYLIFKLKSESNAICCYVEDGSSFYIDINETSINEMETRDQRIKNFLKKYLFGKEYIASLKRLRLHGTYPLIDNLYGLFPQYINREEMVSEIIYTESVIIKKYYPEVFTYLENIFKNLNLDEVSVFFCPFFETFDNSTLKKQIIKLLEFQKLSKVVIVKNHPRQDPKYLTSDTLERIFLEFGFKALIINPTIPSELVYEFLKYKSYRIRNVISSGTCTTLLSARKVLNQNLELVAMLPEHQYVSNFFEKFRIKVFFYER